MPFRRRFRRRRRRPVRRRRRFRGRMRRRRLMIDPEMKTIDTVITLPVSDTGSSFFLNGAPQGTNVSNRQGFQLKVLSSLITMNWEVDGAAPQASIRMWLVWDKQPNFVLATINDLLSIPAEGIVTPLNLNNGLRFKVLWTEKRQFTNAMSHLAVRKFKRMSRLTRFTTANGEIGDCNSGALILMLVSSQAALNAPPVLTFHSRCRFIG